MEKSIFLTPLLDRTSFATGLCVSSGGIHEWAVEVQVRCARPDALRFGVPAKAPGEAMSQQSHVGPAHGAPGRRALGSPYLLTTKQHFIVATSPPAARSRRPAGRQMPSAEASQLVSSRRPRAETGGMRRASRRGRAQSSTRVARRMPAVAVGRDVPKGQHSGHVHGRGLGTRDLNKAISAPSACEQINR